MNQDTKSEFVGDERSVAPLIGFILLFAMGIIAFSSYQAFVVPNQNAEVEVSHNEQIKNDFVDFRSNLINAIAGSADRSKEFTLGTQYPSRLVALNPPNPSGSLRTTDPGPVELGGISIENVCGATDGGDTASKSLVYKPQYTEYQEPQSTVYENTFVGSKFQRGQFILQSQRMIQENSLELTLLTGNVSETGTGSVGIDMNATHRYTADQKVTSVTVPSQFDSDIWENQILDEEDNVANIETTGDGRIKIEFSDPLRVSCAVVGLNENPTFKPPVDSESGGGGGNGDSRYSVDWQSPTNQNTNSYLSSCSDTECTWDVGADSDSSLTLLAGTNPAIEGANLDFAVNNSTVGEISPGEDSTGQNGEATTDLTANENGTVAIYVASGGTSDVINITVENVPSLPNGKAAFDDLNGNGKWDEGETTYTADEVGDLDLRDTDLVIERDVTTDRIDQKKIDSILIKDGVTVETTSDKLNLEIEGGSIEASGATLIDGSGNDLGLKISSGSGDINIDDASIESGGKISAEIDGEGGSIDSSGSTLVSTDGDEIKLDIKKGDGNIDIEDARLESDGKLIAEGNGDNSKLFANDNGGTESDGGTYVVNNDDSPAELEVKDIDTSSATLEKGTIK